MTRDSTADRAAADLNQASGESGSIACFVSPHGFGHAARAAAVVEALSHRSPGLGIDLFTTVPEWFFERSLTAPYRYRFLESDVGMVQKSSLEEDPGGTADALDRLYPPARKTLDKLAAQLVEAGCRLVLCDISPLGLAVAEVAGIPSVLQENFTWDWIYEPFIEDEPRLRNHRKWLEESFASADLHIQLQPFCRPSPAAWTVPPVSRSPRQSPIETRRELSIDPSQRIVLVSMGGVEWSFDALPESPDDSRIVYVVPGGAARFQRHRNVVLLPHHSDFYHPDLVAAADLVIGKLGYSTVAEAYWSGAGFAYVRRPRFAESAVLERFVLAQMPATEIPLSDFSNGSWSPYVTETLCGPRPRRGGSNGADVIADRLDRMLRQGTD